MPECGLITVLSKTRGDTIKLQFIAEKSGEFQWFDGNDEVIKIDGIIHQQKSDRNNMFTLKLFNVSQSQSGHYKVQCASGTKTSSIKVDVIGKLDFYR